MTGHAKPTIAQTLNFGNVYTVSSLSSPGELRTDPSQLCSAGGYFTMTGDWLERGSTVTSYGWPAPGEQDAVPRPAFQAIQVRGVQINTDIALGGLDLTLSAD